MGARFGVGGVDVGCEDFQPVAVFTRGIGELELLRLRCGRA